MNNLKLVLSAVSLLIIGMVVGSQLERASAHGKPTKVEHSLDDLIMLPQMDSPHSGITVNQYGCLTICQPEQQTPATNEPISL